MATNPPPIPPADIYSRKPHAQFTVENLQPNSVLYIGSDDTFVIDAQNTAAGIVIQIVGRYMDTSGRLVPFAYQFTPTSDRVLNTFTFSLAEGWLMSMSIGTVTTGVTSGQCFVRAFLYRGLPPTGQLVSQFMASYITSNTWANWPFGSVTSSLSGPGRNYRYLGTTPAVGAEMILTVPAHARWRILSILQGFTTSAAVANRIPTLAIDFAGQTSWVGRSPYTQAASLYIVYEWFFGQGVRETTPALTHIQFPFPSLILDPGTTIRTYTVALQATDAYDAVIMYVEEWLVP